MVFPLGSICARNLPVAAVEIGGTSWKPFISVSSVLLFWGVCATAGAPNSIIIGKHLIAVTFEYFILKPPVAGPLMFTQVVYATPISLILCELKCSAYQATSKPTKVGFLAEPQSVELCVLLI